MYRNGQAPGSWWKGVASARTSSRTIWRTPSFTTPDLLAGYAWRTWPTLQSGGVANYIPEPADGFTLPQSNDVEVDQNGLIYLLDRDWVFDILEMDM